MNAKRAALALGIAAAVTGAGSIPAAYAGYPIKCQNNHVVVVDDQTGAQTPEPTIQAGILAAQGSTTGSGSGDTVIVCKGVFNENVTVPAVDVPDPSDIDPSTGDPREVPNNNITIRAYDDTNEAKVVGKAGSPVFSISAPGVTLGGPGMGLTITGASSTGVYVGEPTAIDYNEDDDQPYQDCPNIGTVDPSFDPTQCADKEKAAFATTNVSIVGNRISGLTQGSGNVVGILVQNTNNTLVFRNLVTGLTAGPGARAAGIVFSLTNYNPDVLGDAVTNLTQTGGDCGDATAGSPSNGAVGVSIEDEALDALVYDTVVDKVSAGCAAVGVFSNAWGGLENDRNGQQVPIATDLVDNRIKHVRGRDGGSSSGVVLSPVKPQTKDNESPVSSFRVLANDIDDTAIAIDVQTPLALYSYIRENDLDTDAVGVNNGSADTLDATNNWWGCDEGPRVASNPYSTGHKECASITEATPGTTTYNPWTKHHIDHAGAHAGEYAGHN